MYGSGPSIDYYRGETEMLMTVAMVLLGLLALGFAILWRRRLTEFDPLISTMEQNFDTSDVDISGNKKYTNCISHKWVMKNVVRGDYSRSGESLSDFVGNNTLMGTMILGIAMGIGPVLLVLVMFQSFFVAGASLATVVIAVFVVRPSGEVGVSYNLLQFLEEQEYEELSKGDYAYAATSTSRIKRWSFTLIIIGIAALALAPIGDLLPDMVGFGIASYFALFMQYIFLPIAEINFPLALMAFIVGVPLLPLILFAVFRIVQSKVRARREPTGI